MCIRDSHKTGSLKRDFDATVSDFIALVFDTFNDATNAFAIGSNHLAIQRDLLIFNGGSPQGRSYDMSWDIKWYSESKIYESFYTTEWKIPLSSFRYSEGETKWRMGSYQRDTKNNAWNLWHKVPEDQEFSNLAFLGDMFFEKPLKKSKSKTSLIPYINAISNKDFLIPNADLLIWFIVKKSLTKLLLIWSIVYAIGENTKNNVEIFLKMILLSLNIIFT